jgi:hypothetical protein
MNRREAILAASVGGVLALFAGLYALNVVNFQPVRELDKQIAGAREKIAKIQTERRTYFSAEDRLKTVTGRTFADTVDQASARSGEMLTQQILAAGLAETAFNRTPFGPRTLRGANEIGWTVQGTGSLSNVVNLVFLLNESPWLHRTEGLSVGSGEVPGIVRVNFRYLTLVIDPAPDVVRTNLVAKLGLDSPRRHLLNGIVSRDILRPYIRRPPPTVPGQTPASASKRNLPPGPETFRVVSLTEWQGRPEIHVRDLSAQKTMLFKPGDELAGGIIVMVDYRPMPKPGNSLLQSFSRLILKIGDEFWAIERGRTLADKRKLSTDELPPTLTRSR